ncbi:MAG: O-antigen ligase family protein [Patescibacteria group bacterium]
MDNLRARLTLFAQSALSWGMYLLAFLLPTLFYLRTYDSAMIKITTAQLGALFLVGFWVVKTIEMGRLEWPAPLGKILRPAFLLLVWTLLSYLFSSFKIASMHQFVQGLIFLAAFMLGALEFSSWPSCRRLIDWILASSLVVSLYGLVQWVDISFFPPQPASGIDPFIWRQAFGDRVFSTLGNPDLLACFLVGALPLALAAFMGLRNFRSLRSLLTAALLPLVIFSAIQSYSSKGVPILFTVFIFVGLTWKFCKQKTKALTLAVAILAVAAILSVVLAKPQRWKERVTYDISFLKHTWTGTWNMIKRNPLLGTGPGSFSVVYPEFRKPEIIKLEGRHNTETDHPENELLEVWSELGLIGLVLFVWTFWNVFYAAFIKIKQYGLDHEDNTLWLIALFCSVLGLFLSGLTNALGTRFVAPGFVFWLLAGVLGGVAATSLESNIKFSVYSIPISIGLSRLAYVPIVGVLGYLGCGVFSWFASDLKLNEAIMNSKQKSWEQALSLYNQITPGYPTYLMSQYFQANVYADRAGEEDLERAVEQYLKVKQLAPHYVQVDHRLGNIYAQLNQWDKAIASYLASEKLDPIFKENYQRLVWSYLQKGERVKSQEVYDRFLKFHPNEKGAFEDFIKMSDVSQSKTQK